MAFLSGMAAEEPSSRGSSQTPEAPRAPNVFRVTIQNLNFHNKDTGFFVAEAVAAGPVPPLPPEIQDLGVRVPRTLKVTGVSQAFEGTDQVGATLECVGEWVVNPRHGLQFDVAFVQDAIPTTVDALEKYLGSGQLKGIGPAVARSIVDKWGLDTLRILENTPERLVEIPGLTEAKSQQIAESWRVKREAYGVVSFLGLHGIGETLAMKVREAFGSQDVERRVRANPYLLTEIEGIGFQKADAVALSIGFPANSPQRLAAALQHVLRDSIDKNGHTAITGTQWMDEAVAQLRRPRDEIKAMCQKLIDSKVVVLRSLRVNPDEPPVSCVSPIREARWERSVANHLKRLIENRPALTLDQEASIQRIISDPSRRLDPSQKDAGLAVFKSPVSVLTGGPGTGKTTTLRSIVAAATDIGWSVVLAAPTGRAAKRMEEAIGMPAATMHRSLKFIPGKGFAKNENDPMVGNLFVVDEASMVDTGMAAAWVRAIPTGATVLFVGDADQLPSVGAGDVLRDFIRSGRVPVARLTRVHRQAEGSGIAWNATQVLQGKSPAMNGDPWRDDFAFIKADNDLAIQESLVEVIEGLLRQGVPPSDIQILCPQKNLDCGTEALNDLLRGLLNPERPDAQRLAEGLCVGERLMQTKNDYELEVFNGDMGTVTKFNADGSLLMEMEDGRIVQFPKTSLKNLLMGYAITVHKSQGGERPVVLMPISRGHSFTLNRSLLYTAITRGKDRVMLIGDARTTLLSAKKKSQLVRVTGLNNEMAVVGVPEIAPASKQAFHR